MSYPYGLFDPYLPKQALKIQDAPVERVEIISIKDAICFFEAVEKIIESKNASDLQLTLQLTDTTADGGRRSLESVIDLSLKGAHLPLRHSISDKAPRLDCFYFSKDWHNLQCEQNITINFIVFLLHLRLFQDGEERPKWVSEIPWCKELISVANTIEAYRRNLKHDYIAIDVAHGIEGEFGSIEKYKVIRQITLSLMRHCKYSKSAKNSAFIGTWLRALRNCITLENESAFADYFTIAYMWSYGPDASYPANFAFSAQELILAYKMNLLPKNDFIRVLLESCRQPSVAKALTQYDMQRTIAHDIPELHAIIEKLIDTVVEVECRTGPTDVSVIARGLSYISGVNNLARILRRYAKDGSRFVNNDTTNNSMGFHLLSICFPKKDDSLDDLNSILGHDTPDTDTLLNVIEIAPQWINLLPR